VANTAPEFSDHLGRRPPPTAPVVRRSERPRHAAASS
jgi:hypothetical protein